MTNIRIKCICTSILFVISYNIYFAHSMQRSMFDVVGGSFYSLLFQFCVKPTQQHQPKINKLSNNNSNNSSNSCQCYRLMQVTDNSLKSQVYSLPITVYFQQRSLIQNTGNSRSKNEKKHFCFFFF